MTIPRGFTRCDECHGSGWKVVLRNVNSVAEYSTRIDCPSCSGSGLLPTEKLREEAAVALYEGSDRFGNSRSTMAWANAGDHYRGWIQHQADVLLAKVAEHLKGTP